MNDVQRLARRRAEAGLVIQLAIEQTEPLAGTASTHGAAPVTFVGWLDLLRALSELMCAAGQPTEDGPGSCAASHDMKVREGRRQEPARPVMVLIVGDAVVDDLGRSVDEALRANSSPGHNALLVMTALHFLRRRESSVDIAMRRIGMSAERSDVASDLPKSDAEWRERLTPEQYYILRQKGTERPWSGEYNLTKQDGIYRCAGCGAELFRSDSKFDSHCGWPSFTEPAAAGTVDLTTDTSHGMIRTEVTCRRCGGHLGHVFDDGPAPTGQRYCINSVSLKLDHRATDPAGPR